MPRTVVPKKPFNKSGNMLIIVSLLVIVILYFFSTNSSILDTSKLPIFKMMFISIIIEALPFILIGVLISALIEVFVPERVIKNIIPKNPVLAILTACLLGIIFPICECGMVPAVRRLIQKGMPTYVATTFILVGPILNPIVFWSTFTAFRNKPEIVYSRMGLAFVVAFIIGLILYRFVKNDQLKQSDTVHSHDQHGHSHDHQAHHDHSHAHHDDHNHDHNHGGQNKLKAVMDHSISEFFDMGKYLIFGALLVGLLQTFVSKGSLVALGQEGGSATLLMMGLGFILSLCSTSDAFVAQSFVTSFSAGSLVAFMVVGPMLNLKGLLMMTAVFKPRFVLLYSVLVIVGVYAGTLILERLVLK